MNPRVWKRNEREVARDFGTERTPLSGGNSRITRSDTLHRKLFIGVKRRKLYNILRTFRDMVKPARKERKVPVLVLVEKRSHGYWVVVYCNDLPAFSEQVRKTWRRKV